MKTVNSNAAIQTITKIANLEIFNTAHFIINEFCIAQDNEMNAQTEDKELEFEAQANDLQDKAMNLIKEIVMANFPTQKHLNSLVDNVFWNLTLNF